MQFFSGTWLVDGADPTFDLSPGVTLVIQPGRQGQVFGSPSFLQLGGGGNLILGPGSYLTGWKSALGVLDGSTLTIGDRAWLANSTDIVLGADGTNTTLRYIDDRPVTFFGVLNVGAVGAISTIDISSAGQPTGALTISGGIQGDGDLRIFNSSLAAAGTVTLNFANGGSYGGALVLDGANVRLNTANGIGAQLVVQNESRLTFGSSMTFGAAQEMLLADNLQLRGATGAERVIWNGKIDAGGKILELDQIQLTTSPTADLSGPGNILLNPGGILDLNGASATDWTVIGNGGLLSGPGAVNTIGGSGAGGFNGTIQFGNGTTRGTLQVTGNANLGDAFLESMMYAGSGTADVLDVGGALTGLAQSSVDMIYNATTSGGPLIPANGASTTYTVISANTMPNEKPKELAVTLIDPLNNNYSILLLDPSNPNTTASGA
ncbi:MAG: hypothetical protein ACKPEA_09005, partial [Planctomycetota bacterium]